MELLVNDLSLHGQYPDLSSFQTAARKVMVIRQILRRFGRELYCHRNITNAPVTRTMAMPQAVQALSKDERRALMQWLTRNGPFWEDIRNHDPGDWFECEGKIVTDSAIGEAAWCCMNNIDRRLVSFSQSDWEFSPLSVHWRSEKEKSVDVKNYWDPDALEAVLQAAPVQIASWPQLEDLVTVRCPNLRFASDAFAPLQGTPFSSSAARRLLFIFDTLNRLMSCFDAKGQRTPEGQEIYNNFFTGKAGNGGRGPIFTDSSEDEKRRFRSAMTFKNPDDGSRTIFCPWHGKVQTPQLRVHFSWPVQANKPLYVLFVGPKLTKR